MSARRAVLVLAAFVCQLAIVWPADSAHAVTALTTTSTTQSWCRYGVRCVQRRTATSWGLPGLCGTPAYVVVTRRHALGESRTAAPLHWTRWRVVHTYAREHACR